MADEYDGPDCGHEQCREFYERMKDAIPVIFGVTQEGHVTVSAGPVPFEYLETVAKFLTEGPHIETLKETCETQHMAWIARTN